MTTRYVAQRDPDFVAPMPGLTGVEQLPDSFPPTAICAECKNEATKFCDSCESPLCEDCSAILHGLQNRKDHRVRNILTLDKDRKKWGSRLFFAYDATKKGTLNQSEFGGLLRVMQPETTPAMLASIVERVAGPSGAEIGMTAFLEFVASMFGSTTTEDFQQLIAGVIASSPADAIDPKRTLYARWVFLAYDADKSGSIDFEEFGSMVKVIDSEMEEAELKATFMVLIFWQSAAYKLTCSGTVTMSSEY